MAQYINYFTQQAKRASKAAEHTRQMEQIHAEEIAYSSTNAKIYSPDTHFRCFDEAVPPVKTTVAFEATDSVSAVLAHAKENKKEAVLNFASYKNAGGMFMQGSSAQEESLCHESTLYNVLKTHEDSYYGQNRNMLNKALYTNRALYTPSIVFERGQGGMKCDVITCAAPNFSAAARFCQVSEEENDAILKDRCRFVLTVAKENHVETLILGAFGCGVFRQDAHRVGQIFGELLNDEFKGAFPEVVFACLPGQNFEDLKCGVEETLDLEKDQDTVERE